MSSYKETTESGDITRWNRARQIVCDNPVEGAPGITVYEHEATRLPDGSVIEKSLGSLTYAMTDPTVEIPLIDPETYEPTEATFTAGQFQVMAASVAMWQIRQHKGISDG